jgi:hypothetical protein
MAGESSGLLAISLPCNDDAAGRRALVNPKPVARASGSVPLFYGNAFSGNGIFQRIYLW